MLFPSSFLFFCPLSRFIQHSPSPLICERQKRSLPCTPRVSHVQREWGSIHVMRQTVRRVCSVTLTPSPWHDLCWLTSCSPSSGFKKTVWGCLWACVWSMSFLTRFKLTSRYIYVRFVCYLMLPGTTSSCQCSTHLIVTFVYRKTVPWTPLQCHKKHYLHTHHKGEFG